MKTLFTNKFKLNLWKKLVTCYIWSTAFYGLKRRYLKKYIRYMMFVGPCMIVITEE